MNSSGPTARLCAFVLPWLTACAAVSQAPTAKTTAWPDTFAARVEALALLQTLNADLLSHDSATLTLTHWCERHRLAASPRLLAERIPDAQRPASAEQRLELGVTPTEPVRYRRVRLVCGSIVLSEADNWYIPGRLTPEMNTLLETTDVPFGRVVQALHFQRRTLSSTLLWLPLPDGWELSGSGTPATSAPLAIPAHVLEHRAILTLPDGTPFSEVVETYTNGVLAFPIPRP